LLQHVAHGYFNLRHFRPADATVEHTRRAIPPQIKVACHQQAVLNAMVHKIGQTVWQEMAMATTHHLIICKIGTKGLLRIDRKSPQQWRNSGATVAQREQQQA
jgi:hypothetical protein